ncbi:ImmA/IrrE family metallo-endopeptidase [Moraxella bovoculi]|uniref:ImmA/IrrE family metallo-endopeptidase n=1 Tax=Moraxella bovoculi TaxID=386891 RepID=UPI003F4FE67B
MADYIQHSPLAVRHYREQIGLSREFLAKKSDIALSTLEKGEQQNLAFSYNQIQKLAKFLFVPDFYLLTDQIQDNGIPETVDHRNINPLDNSEDLEYKSQKALHELIDNRNNLIYTFESMDESIDRFSLELSGNDAISDAELIRHWLGVDQAKFKTQNNDDYYRSWRTLIEKNNVMVIELSKTKIGSEGMAIYYDSFPIIAILSSGQSHSRRLFTMIHELVHLGLRQSAIDGNILAETLKLEQYCNQVAGHVLLPKNIADNLYDNMLDLASNINRIRKSIKVSRQAIAIQLKLLGLIDQSSLNAYLSELEANEDRANASFGVPSRSRTHNQFGRIYLQQVITAVWHNAIPITTAMKMLRLKDVNDLMYLEQKVFS